MRTTKIRGACPSCYRQMISATDVFSDEVPIHGDIAMCSACGEVSMFDFTRRRNTLRKPTVKERLGIDRNVTASRVRRHQAERGLH